MDSVTLQDANACLQEDLRKAGGLFAEGDRILACTNMIGAVIQFQSVVDPDDIAGIIALCFELEMAVVGMQQGVPPPPWIVPVVADKAPGRPPGVAASFSAWLPRTIAAIAMDELMAAGFLRGPAARAAAAAYEAAGQKAVGWRTVASWRDQLYAGTAPRTFVTVYRKWPDKIGRGDRTGDEAERLILDWLAASLKKFGLGRRITP